MSRRASHRTLSLDLANILKLPLNKLRGETVEEEWDELAAMIRDAVQELVNKKGLPRRDRNED